MQVLKEEWKIVVRLFGDWSAAEDTKWLEVASAAAYGSAGCKWSERMQELGQEELGLQMARSVEDACVLVGLADSHESLLKVRVCCIVLI